ncbi:4848_t:CDS:2, partial [Racocetra persica]
KIKLVRQNETNNQMMSVWAIGSYIGQDDNEIEMTIYIPINPEDHDPDTQAIFKRDEYYLIGGKIISTHYAGITRPKMTVSASKYLIFLNKDSMSNKSPLKVSLVGIPQKMPTEFNDTDAILETVMTDYINGQEREYTINIVFPYNNPRFSHLKTTIRPYESEIFIIGLMEIIDHNLYVYTKEI